jgi:membrane protein DedA with SNARE-associated domain
VRFHHNGQVFDATVISFLLEKIQNLPGTLVYLVVALLVFSEAALFVGFVLPGETAVIVAGVVASKGHVNLAALCVLVVTSAIVGDSVGYAIGRRYGERLIALPFLRSRRASIDRAMEGLRRRGPIYVFVGRFTAFLRAVMPGLAGMSRLRYGRFLIANASGAVMWGVSYTLLGYFAGTALNSIERVSGWVGIGVLVAVIAAVVIIVLLKRRAEAKIASALDHPSEDDRGDSAKGFE